MNSHRKISGDKRLMLAMKCLHNIKNNNDGRTKQSVRSDIENSQIPIIQLTLDICGCSEAT